jgi:polyribonucleotide nucleotidyltransferase
MINSITEQTGADISIEDDGTIYVGAADGPSAQAAVDMINAIANPQMPKIGERYLGTVVKTAAFGAFVSLVPGRDGLVHISKLGGGKRIGKVEDVVNVGDKIRVEITDIDNRGKISLVPVKEEDAADAPATDTPADDAPEGTGAEGAGVPPAEPATSGAVTGAIGGGTRA